MTCVVRVKVQSPHGSDFQSQPMEFTEQRSSPIMQLEISLKFSKNGLSSVRNLALGRAVQ